MRTRRRKKLHWYRVVLDIWERDDIREPWNTRSEIVYATWSYERALNFIRTHSYLETDMDPDDDGSYWLSIKTLYLFKIR